MMQHALKLLTIEQMKAINTLSTQEPRVVKKTILADGVVIGLEEEDLRVAYLNAVSNLTILLHSEFDKIMQEYYSKNIIFLEGFAYEIVDKIEDKKFNEKLKSKSGDEKKDFLLFYQVQQARKMYQQINLFLQRTNLLKMEDDNAR